MAVLHFSALKEKCYSNVHKLNSSAWIKKTMSECHKMSGQVIRVKQRIVLAIILAQASLGVFLCSPWSLAALMGSVQGLAILTVVLTAAVLLLWSTIPPVRVNPAGKAVFITGCDTGFGRELAIRLDQLGFQVFAGCLAPDRASASLGGVSSDRLKVVALDVTDELQVSRSVQFVKQQLGENELWALVNNAGVATFCEIEWCSLPEFQRIFDVNVFGVVRVTKSFLPLLRQSPSRVINVASLAGRFTLPAFAAYSMSKNACIAFSDDLRQEMSKFNVSVITIEPGLYKTAITDESHILDKNRQMWNETPAEIKSDYGQEYFDVFLEQVSRSLRQARPMIQEVVESMVEAVSARGPQHRYVPYWRFRLRALIMGCLPTTARDKLFAARFPMAQPQSMKNKSYKSSKNVLERAEICKLTT